MNSINESLLTLSVRTANSSPEPDLIIEDANPSACRMLGYSQEELAGRNYREIFIGDTRLFLNRLLKEGGLRGLEKNYRLHDGSEIPVLVSGSILYDPAGKVERIICLAYDNSKQKRIEQALIRSGQLKDEFRMHVSNELRTPLDGIIGIGESLLDGTGGTLSNAQKMNLEMIVSGGKQLSHIAYNLMDLSQLEYNDLNLKSQPVDIRSIVDAALAFAQPQFAQKSLELKNMLPPKLPPVLGDEVRLQYIMQNIVKDVVRLAKNNIMLVSASVRNGSVEVMLTDMDRSLAESYEATGFAGEKHAEVVTPVLTATRQILELHGGRIRMNTDGDRCDTFYITLPVAGTQKQMPEIIPEKTQETAENISPALENDELQTGETSNILLVDNEILNLQALENHLFLRGYQVLKAATGQLALEMIRREKPDLVIVDMFMSDLSGFEICNKIREVYSMNELPVILLTTRNHLDNFLGAIAASANDYLIKPFSKHELLARVQTHIRVSNFGTALTQANRRLALLLRATREMASTHDKIQVMQKAVEAIFEEFHEKSIEEIRVYIPAMSDDYLHMRINRLNFADDDEEIFADILDQLPDTLEEMVQEIGFDEAVSLKFSENGLLLIACGKEGLMGLLELRDVNQTPAYSEQMDFLEALMRSLRTSLENINITENLDTKVRERTVELNAALDRVGMLKEKQDGDYFLTSLLTKPLCSNYVSGGNIKIDFFVKQKKEFQFRKRRYEIGGDINIAHRLELGGRSCSIFLNGDAMGKSLQGASGVLVLGSVFNAIIERTKIMKSMGEMSPERWLEDAVMEMHRIFESFEGSMLVSLVLGLVDEEEGTFLYINAEHPYPVLLREGAASFLDTGVIWRKLGTPIQEHVLTVQKVALLPNDIIVLGSDGRDDIIVGVASDGTRIINEDEQTFLKTVEGSGGDLEMIYQKTLRIGEITDDYCLLRLEYGGD